MAVNQIWGPSQDNPYPQTEFLDEGTKRPSRAWQVWFLNLLNFTRTSASASKGSSVLPSNPAGFIEMTVNGKIYKVPYYNV
ncbi:hypothetical protein UFOVP192_30 [uncultured Caudovirales phage]|uniref:Uncharacterized protein n=1 Tax=uncultured Caudovirales phage TaxID=2100421 RepID=A0A6J7WID9_9CAUD|nr:hypothetical protein UFOVP192_30 [uncultured Caudovirales phage]